MHMSRFLAPFALTLCTAGLFAQPTAQPSMEDHIRESMGQLVAQLDANADGQLTVDEMPPGDMGQVLMEADTDGDGAVTLDELAAAAMAEFNQPPVNTIEDLMAQIDTDGNGLVEGEEILDEQMAAWVAQVDTGGDEAVDIDELTVWIDAQQHAELQMMVQQIMMQFDADGDGSILIATEIPEAGPVQELAAADLNGDGAITAAELEEFAIRESGAAMAPRESAPASEPASAPTSMPASPEQDAE